MRDVFLSGGAEMDMGTRNRKKLQELKKNYLKVLQLKKND